MLLPYIYIIKHTVRAQRKKGNPFPEQNHIFGVKYLNLFEQERQTGQYFFIGWFDGNSFTGFAAEQAIVIPIYTTSIAAKTADAGPDGASLGLAAYQIVMIDIVYLEFIFHQIS